MVGMVINYVVSCNAFSAGSLPALHRSGLGGASIVRGRTSKNNLGQFEPFLGQHDRNVIGTHARYLNMSECQQQ